VRQIQNGPSLVEIDGDLVRTEVRADATIETARSYLDLVEEVLNREGRCFQLVINDANWGMSSDARRYTFEWSQRQVTSGSVIVGGGLALRTLMTMLMRALALFSTRAAPIVFFATEAEGRAWIDKQRQLLLNKQIAIPPPF
jgi:hypothetical protein